MDPRIKRLYWQITALLLAAHFAGWAAAMPLSLALTALQTLHFLAGRSARLDRLFGTFYNPRGRPPQPASGIAVR